MKGTVGVIVATFGDKELWRPLAMRALRSVHRQTYSVFSRWEYGETLSSARNAGANYPFFANREWFIFLDADDELDSKYVEEMMKTADETGCDLVWPATIGVYEDGSEDEIPDPHPPSPNSLLYTNNMAIGTMIRASLFHEVGGFRELDALEDWDLWVRCWFAGATMIGCPTAIYKVHVRENSRNASNGAHHRVYQQLRAEYDSWVRWSPR